MAQVRTFVRETLRCSSGIKPPSTSSVFRPPPRAVNAMHVATALSLVNGAYRTAVHRQMSTELHMFVVEHQVELHGIDQPFAPTACYAPAHLRHYLRFHYGEARPSQDDVLEQGRAFDRWDGRNASSVRLDIRVPGACGSIGGLTTSPQYFHHWVAAAMVMCRLSIPNLNLKALHLRVTSKSDLIMKVEEVLSASINLTDVVIESDCICSPPNDLPILNLGRTTSHTKQYASLDRLVLRLPGVVIDTTGQASLINRSRNVPFLCVVADRVIDPGPTWQWAQGLLKAHSAVKYADISITTDDTDTRPRGQAVGMVRLLFLEHLMVNFSQADTELLRDLDAPNLRLLQLKTNVSLSTVECCQLGQFASLHDAEISCPGSIRNRFTAIGISDEQYKAGVPEQCRRNKFYHGAVRCRVTPVVPSTCSGSNSPPSASKRLRTSR
ncbi:hypothetical protein V8E36_001097 [Tilletia maclaganii]